MIPIYLHSIKIIPKPLLLIFLFGCSDSHIITTNPLGSQLSSFGSEVVLITGEEEWYNEYPELKQSLLNNRDKGLEEGFYTGSHWSTVNKNKATKINFYFFQDKLYKIRWTYHRLDYPELESLSEETDAYFESLLGEPNGQSHFGNMIWKTEGLFLQTFLDIADYQIELRVDSIHQVVNSLN
jgi:hypothetical protein